MSFSVRIGASALAVTMAAGAAFAQDDAWWARAGAAYEGATIRGVTGSTPPPNDIGDVLAPRFEELTGIEVEIGTTSWDQMHGKAIRDMEAGTGLCDMACIGQDIIDADLARDVLVNVTERLERAPALLAPGFDEATFADSVRGEDGGLYGLPMEAFVKVHLHRTDLFGDPGIPAAFETEHGRPLAPATTHEERTEIAEIFAACGQERDLGLWGTTAQVHTGHPASRPEMDGA